MKYVKRKVIWSPRETGQARGRLFVASKKYRVPRFLDLKKEEAMAEREMRRSNARLGGGVIKGG